MSNATPPAQTYNSFIPSCDPSLAPRYLWIPVQPGNRSECDILTAILRLIDRGEAHVATNTTDPMPDGLYWGMNISLDGLARGDGEVTWLMREEIIEMKKHAVRLEDQRQRMMFSPRKSWREALGSGFLSTFGFGGGIDRDGTGDRTWYGASTNEASKRNVIDNGAGRLNDNGDDPINGYPDDHERSRKNDRHANWFGRA